MQQRTYVSLALNLCNIQFSWNKTMYTEVAASDDLTPLKYKIQLNGDTRTSKSLRLLKFCSRIVDNMMWCSCVVSIWLQQQQLCAVRHRNTHRLVGLELVLHTLLVVCSHLVCLNTFFIIYTFLCYVRCSTEQKTTFIDSFICHHQLNCECVSILWLWLLGIVSEFTCPACNSLIRYFVNKLAVATVTASKRAQDSKICIERQDTNIRHQQ